jgi:hypothetical protein
MVVSSSLDYYKIAAVDDGQLLLGAERKLPSPPPQPSPIKEEGEKGRN